MYPINDYTNIVSESTGVLIKSGPGVLHAVNLNNGGSVVGNIITLYDGTSSSTSATLICSEITPTSRFRLYEVGFATGLYCASTTFVSTANNVTLSWR